MTNLVFIKAEATFDYTPYQKEVAPLEAIRKQFLAYFNEDKLRHMKIEDTQSETASKTGTASAMDWSAHLTDLVAS